MVELAWPGGPGAYQVALVNRQTRRWRYFKAEARTLSLPLEPGVYLAKVRRRFEGEKPAYGPWSEAVRFAWTAEHALQVLDQAPDPVTDESLPGPTGLEVALGQKDFVTWEARFSWEGETGPYQLALLNRAADSWEYFKVSQPEAQLELGRGQYLVRVREIRPEDPVPRNGLWSEELRFLVGMDRASLLLNRLCYPVSESDQEILVEAVKAVMAGIPDPRRLSHQTVRDLIALCDRIQDSQVVLETLRPLFAHWQKDYERLIREIRAEGYWFASLEKFTVGHRNQPLVHFRYDIHIGDILPAYGVIDSNLRLGVPGVFYLLWDHLPKEESFRKEFLSLKRFEGTYVHFGLHAHPTEAVLIRQIFHGNVDAFQEWRDSPAAEGYFRNLVDPVSGEPTKVLERYIEAGEKYLRQITDSFLVHFPHATTVSGHGSPLCGLVVEAYREDPKYKAVHDVFSSPAFLNSERLYRVGLFFEPRNFCSSAPYHVFEGSEGDWVATMMRASMTTGKSLVLLFHPGKSQRGDFSLKSVPPIMWHETGSWESLSQTLCEDCDE